MDNTEKIVRQFMSETKPFTYKDNDGRLMTDLANFFDWLAKNKQLTLTDVVASKCECDAPLIRTGEKNIEYCGKCELDL